MPGQYDQYPASGYGTDVGPPGYNTKYLTNSNYRYYNSDPNHQSRLPYVRRNLNLENFDRNRDWELGLNWESGLNSQINNRRAQTGRRCNSRTRARTEDQDLIMYQLTQLLKEVVTELKDVEHEKIEVEKVNHRLMEENERLMEEHERIRGQNQQLSTENEVVMGENGVFKAQIEESKANIGKASLFKNINERHTNIISRLHDELAKLRLENNELRNLSSEGGGDHDVPVPENSSLGSNFDEKEFSSDLRTCETRSVYVSSPKQVNEVVTPENGNGIVTLLDCVKKAGTADDYSTSVDGSESGTPD